MRYMIDKSNAMQCHYRKILTIVLFIFLSSCRCFSQVHIAEREHVSERYYFEKLLSELGVSDTTIDNATELFRYGDGRCILEMRKHDGKLFGRLINYVNRHKSPLFDSIPLTQPQLNSLDSLLKAHRIDTLPNGKEIDRWPLGFDGVMYNFAFGHVGNMKVSAYWTPEVVDLPEAKQIVAFNEAIEKALNLDRQYSTFQDSWPKVGCYHIGSLGMLCYVNPPLFIGYSGSTAYPLGYYIAKGFLLFSGRRYLLLNLSQRFNPHNHTNYFQVNAVPSRLFFTKEDLFDFLKIGFQNRSISDVGEIVHVKATTVMYGLKIKKVGIGIGAMYVNRDLTTWSGFNIYGNYSGLKVVEIDGQISLLNGQTNYEFGLNKLIPLRAGLFKGIDIRLFTEQFYYRRQSGLNLGVSL